MILLWGLPGDRPLADVAACLDRLDRPFVFLDQRLLDRTTVEVALGPPASGQVSIDGIGVVGLEDVTGAYIRPYDSRRVLAATGGSAEALAHAGELDLALLSWADVAPARIVNRPSAMVSNDSKPYQARLIASCGLRTPDTLITNDASQLERFLARHNEIVYKSIGSTRSVVSRLGERHRARYGDLSWCPTQFQQYVPGVDYRVHVLADAVFTARVSSSADDYRYAASAGQSVEICRDVLPADVADRCRRLTHELGLTFSGIDLRRTDSGEWYCFEVNPSPGFSYYQGHTGVSIDLAVAAYLAGEDQLATREQLQT